MTRLLSSLVAIPSVNPMGRHLAGPEYLETRLASYLEDWFRELGVRCERQPVAPGRDNLLAWYIAPDARRLILYDVHQDTVPADGMTIPPFETADFPGTVVGARGVRRQGIDGGDAGGLCTPCARTAAGIGFGAACLHGR